MFRWLGILSAIYLGGCSLLIAVAVIVRRTDRRAVASKQADNRRKQQAAADACRVVTAAEAIIRTEMVAIRSESHRRHPSQE